MTLQSWRVCVRSLFYGTIHSQSLSGTPNVGIADPEHELNLVRVKVQAGGCSIHNGRTWHGSGPNTHPSKVRWLLTFWINCCSEYAAVSLTVQHECMCRPDEAWAFTLSRLTPRFGATKKPQADFGSRTP